MHRSREGLGPDFAYHVTLKVRPGVQSLRTPRVVREVEASFRKACDRGKFKLVEYSLHDDHAHLIVEAKSADELGRGMMSLGARPRAR
jgi:REP element-mobilizing transposase RayT